MTLLEEIYAAMEGTYGNSPTVKWDLPANVRIPDRGVRYADLYSTNWWDDPMTTINVTTLKSLTAVLQRSEKELLRAQGKHPRKDRTNNLVNYVGLLSDTEADLLLQMLQHDRPDLHLGMLPFVNRNYALDVVYSMTKRHIPRYSNYQEYGTVSGRMGHTVVTDEVDQRKLNVQEVLRSKIDTQQKLMRAIR